jgi:hypothetical protein
LIAKEKLISKSVLWAHNETECKNHQRYFYSCGILLCGILYETGVCYNATHFTFIAAEILLTAFSRPALAGNCCAN